ncbi:MAG: GNAT family N-acetyltransferase [Flavobacteriales bacterium]|nr:GNAT family N-acetyltransferase [Flavobacteriales bacterium]|tara:strand:+ start:100 stop:567 length:468 start_codon:yes stop_codon:yes gene_type:complete
MKFTVRPGKESDCAEILSLIKELAVFEKAADEVDIDEEILKNDGFGENPIYDLFVAEFKDKIVGMALFYEKYSTWKGRSIYLEDLIVTEKLRGNGIGKALFNAVAEEAKKRNSGRMEWQVLDWNQSAIDFYKSAGTELDSEWINCKFRREDLQKR